MAEGTNDLALGYMMAADNNGGGNGGFGGFGEGIWAVIILAILFGRGGFGGGFGGGNGGDGVSAGFAWQGIDNGIRGIQNGLCDGFYALNTGLLNGFHGVDRAICDVGHQISDCCCATQNAIQGVRYDLATQACDTRRAIQDSTREILGFLTQDKIATLTTENQALKFAASQAAQNQFITQVGSDIVNRLQPPAVPAYVVPNPYAGFNYNYGNSYGCGCGCNCA